MLSKMGYVSLEFQGEPEHDIYRWESSAYGFYLKLQHDIT